MDRAMQTKQIEWIYDCAERCKLCSEMTCKQPAYVEVIYCPRFTADPNNPSNPANRKKRVPGKK
ncbi:hypothetical protein skT53_24340 [Effusibacillus dendaii]|uniref:Uncharacterized protein n=1 Tax=Effusibacillus dendaii TaxID=2743772 RepID=A0A7I8DER4_9BACL|nr:hypothetical protein skT53_24340 [Effusibacillus dendaii]